jgi:HlyD family secretion protein
VQDALTVPNAALRYAPPPASNGSGSGNGAGLIGLLLPRPPERALPAAVRNGEATVWVLRDGQPVAVPVTLGATDGNRTQITKGGLSEGDAVIVASRTPNQA